MDAIEFHKKWKDFPEKYGEFLIDVMSMFAANPEQAMRMIPRMAPGFIDNLLRWQRNLRWLLDGLGPKKKE